MNKVINGKMYDTKTTIKHFDHTFTEYGQYKVEVLFQKSNEEFFLVRYGFTKSFHPLSIDQAKDWVQKNLSGDDYISIFGEVAE